MENEELVKILKDVDDQLAEIKGENHKLSNEDWKKKRQLLMEKAALEKIKKARENGNSTQEVKGILDYSVATTMKGKNKFLAYLMQLKFRSHIYS